MHNNSNQEINIQYVLYITIYPIIAKIVENILSIHTLSSTSESGFSTVGNIVTFKRKRLRKCENLFIIFIVLCF